MLTTRIAATAVAAACVLGACSSGSDKPEPAASSAAVPRGFDVPAGVTLTKAGTQLSQDKSASVVYQVADKAASAITVTIAQVKKGSIKDFEFFSLDASTKKATPFYVTVEVKNEGPAGLGGAALPIYAHDDSNTNLQASDILGTFKPCQTAKLPRQLPARGDRQALPGLPGSGRSRAGLGRPPDRKRQGRHHLEALTAPLHVSAGEARPRRAAWVRWALATRLSTMPRTPAAMQM
ncbi:hypothetical protein [Aeromicrobium sp. UC242_57]|uniref:hypothetical protein n=1 Tax=Aeromicrobium sp. UC242_57 TaxID=3374624 RepID=UPI0037B48321